MSTLDDAAARWLDGDTSPAVGLMELLILAPDPLQVEAALGRLLHATTAPRWAQRHAAIITLMQEQRAGCERVAQMLAADIDSDAPAPSIDAGLAFCQNLFNWSVQQCPEASVALYSLGSPEILQNATNEIVEFLRSGGLLQGGADTLEVGCGIGRMQQALAPFFNTVVGIDVAAAMLDEARRRCSGLTNVSFLHTSGRDLSMFASASFDLVLAVDSFPYVVQTGNGLVETYMSEIARVLRPGGRFVLMNFSYTMSLQADCEAVQRLAAGCDLGGRNVGDSTLLAVEWRRLSTCKASHVTCSGHLCAANAIDSLNEGLSLKGLLRQEQT